MRTINRIVEVERLAVDGDECHDGFGRRRRDYDANQKLLVRPRDDKARGQRSRGVALFGKGARAHEDGDVDLSAENAHLPVGNVSSVGFLNRRADLSPDEKSWKRVPRKKQEEKI